MEILLNLLILTILIFVKFIFLRDIAVSPKILSLCFVLGLIFGIIILLRLLAFLIGNKTDWESISNTVKEILKTRLNSSRYLKTIIFPLAIISCVGNLITGWPMKILDFPSFLNNAIILGCAMLLLFTLQYLVENLVMKLFIKGMKANR